MNQPSSSNKVASAVGTVLVVAVGGRIAWELLAPAVPLLIVGFGLFLVLSRLFGHRRW